MIEGDTDLGLGIKNLLDSLDPDGLPPRHGIERAQAGVERVVVAADRQMPLRVDVQRAGLPVG